MSGNRFLHSAWPLALMLCVTATAEQVVEIDMRKDKSVEGRYVVFCSRYATEGSRKGDAFVVLARGETSEKLTVERAFGLRMDGSTMTFGPISEKTFKAVRNRSEGPETSTFIVRVDADQYAASMEVIEKWAAQEKYDYPIEVENTDMTLAIAKKLGVYPPYRGAWKPINPILYYMDLVKLNKGYAEKRE